ncbi:MAG TPA: MYXO-CTERM sorting domain-containing protein [Polyangiaceae bacterium]|nr:MYXO-CTERM sorting domain-containing protein [Polyangiaceae bacterium]
MLRLFWSASLLTATLAVSTTAVANGRFPRAERLLEAPTNPQQLTLGATFGLLLTEDGGSSWRHVCEASFADTGLQTDPVIALASDGVLLAGIYASVARASLDACDFQKTLGTSNREAVPDFTLAASVPGRALAVLVSLLDDGTSQNQLYLSENDGKSWSKLGPTLPSSIRSVATIDVAPSDAERVYVSGLDAAGAGVLLRSDDGGQTFEALALPTDSVNDEVPYIAAVDAENPDAIYVRTDQWAFDSLAQVANANDALLYSDDGGRHFTELLRKPGKLFGFTFSPDGREVLLGYGDPLEAGGGRLTESDALGIYRAPKGSHQFEKRYAGSVGCLTWTEQGLYVCTLEADTGFSLGLATDTDFDLDGPANLQPLLRLQDVLGPLECPACTSGSICRNYWESTCQSWGRTDCESLLPTEADACAGAGGESNAGGAAGEAAAKPPTVPLVAGGGCSCRVEPRTHAGAWWALGSTFAFALRRRRQRDSSSSSSRASVWR